jgi:putative membrane protein
MNFLTRWIITSIAIAAAFAVVPGLHIGEGGWLAVAVLALVFGFVNALIRPLLTILTCPFIIFTLGLGIFLINALLFGLTANITNWFGFSVQVDGWFPALLGTIVVSIVSAILNSMLGDKAEQH